MDKVINIPGVGKQTFQTLEESVSRLFAAYLNYASKDIPELSREGFVNAFNQRISQDIYAILSSAPELIIEFLIFLVKLKILKNFKENLGLTTQNAIVISSRPATKGNYHDSGVSGIYVVGSDIIPEINFFKTNLHTSQTLPPRPEQVFDQKMNLDVMDGTVDTSDFVTIKELAQILSRALSEGQTITFCVEEVKSIPPES